MNFQIQIAMMEKKTQTKAHHCKALKHWGQVEKPKTFQRKTIGYRGQRILLASDFNNKRS